MTQKSIEKISTIIWDNFKYNKVLFAISSLWLGHATRTLPVIKYYLNKNISINIISDWNAFNFLKQELKDYKNIKFIRLKDYPAIERWEWLMFYIYLMTDIFSISRLIKEENRFVKNLDEDFDFIFSDWRYWIYKKWTPSFLLSHQISFIVPKWLQIFKNIVNNFNYNYFKKFDAIFIPDYENEDKSLALKLSHSNILKKLKHYYIWTLSSYSKSENIVKDIDYYFIISWYLKEHKESFVNTLINEAKKLKGKKVFVLWDTSKNEIKEFKKDNIVIYSSVSSDQRIDFFNRANIIISRVWYTTVMDLVANNKKAILFPTKNQTEQEYLSKYLDEKWLFINWWEDNFNLEKLIDRLNN